MQKQNKYGAEKLTDDGRKRGKVCIFAFSLPTFVYEPNSFVPKRPDADCRCLDVLYELYAGRCRRCSGR